MFKFSSFLIVLLLLQVQNKAYLLQLENHTTPAPGSEQVLSAPGSEPYISCYRFRIRLICSRFRTIHLLLQVQNKSYLLQVQNHSSPAPGSERDFSYSRFRIRLLTLQVQNKAICSRFFVVCTASSLGKCFICCRFRTKRIEIYMGYVFSLIQTYGSWIGTRVLTVVCRWRLSRRYFVNEKILLFYS